ncbi:hypothetical protein [Pelomonas cellulosilytica]|uniref:Uncharacterized protein n=1 Tax=Pelomonas cellulosilytica TaxID=2906762 RepID=A0ABS8XY73_9BURK|nr:hypothetical protein [Pelomonas sp. P8]MCE4556898.1 hypothetical protein [Pelomonas sp. P8]
MTTKSHLGRNHNGQSGPVKHTAGEFATNTATQGQTLTKQAKAPARRADGTAREAANTPPQHKI